MSISPGKLDIVNIPTISICWSPWMKIYWKLPRYRSKPKVGYPKKRKVSRFLHLGMTFGRIKPLYSFQTSASFYLAVATTLARPCSMWVWPYTIAVINHCRALRYVWISKRSVHIEVCMTTPTRPIPHKTPLSKVVYTHVPAFLPRPQPPAPTYCLNIFNHFNQTFPWRKAF